MFFELRLEYHKEIFFTTRAADFLEAGDGEASTACERADFARGEGVHKAHVFFFAEVEECVANVGVCLTE